MIAFQGILCHSGTAYLKWPMQIMTLSLRSNYQLAHVYKFFPSSPSVLFHPCFGGSPLPMEWQLKAGGIFQLLVVFHIISVLVPQNDAFEILL